jgi:TonB family protein
VAAVTPPKPDAAKDDAKPRPEPEKAAPRDDRAPVPEARNPQPNKPPGEALENARRKASGVGLLAMKNELAQMTGAPLAVQLRDDIKPGPGVGTGQGVGVGAGTEAGIPVRSMITSAAGKGSGGINVAAYSRDTGGGGLAGRSTTLVEGVAGGGGGGGYGGGGSRAGGGGKGGDGAGGTLKKSGSGKASRSIEEIKLVFERHKGAIYALYNRALRDDPSLQGKVVLELKIAPSGEVADIRLVSSELKAAELESKLLARIRQFDFGAKDVEVMVVSWPVDFLPS